MRCGCVRSAAWRRRWRGPCRRNQPRRRLRCARGRRTCCAASRGTDLLDALDAALLLQLAGDPAAALDALRRAQAAGYRDAAYLRVSPLLAPLRAQPGFAALLARNQADIAAQRMLVHRAGLLQQETGAATAAP